MIVFLHMLKTGGTSFRSILEPAFGGRMLLDYDDIPMSNRPEHAVQRRARLAQLRLHGVPVDTEIVFGHFVLSKYLSGTPRPRFGTMLRDPLARTVSHYFHYQRNRGQARNEVLPESLTLLDFARLPKYADTYRFLLGRVAVDELDYVGLTEQFERSLRLFARVFDLNLAVAAPEGIRLNRATEYSDPIAYLQAQGLAEEVAEAQEVNRRIYEVARWRFEDLCAAYAV